MVHALLACNAGAELAALRNLADFNPATLPLTRHLLAMCVSRRLPWGHGCADMVGTAETVQRKPVPHGADETLITLQRPCRRRKDRRVCVVPASPHPPSARLLRPELLEAPALVRGSFLHELLSIRF